MCCSFLCGCLYRSRSCFARLLLPMFLADLALTVYILAQLLTNVPFACCTDPRINDCSYDDIGGANNVGESDGFCYRKDNTTLDCESSIKSCALTELNIDMDELCDNKTLDDVALSNWGWLLAVLCIKVLGLIILIIYDIKHTWCSKTDRDGADEDAEATRRCCACDCTKDCCSSIIFFLFRLFFLICGTAITFAVLALLRYTGSVSRSFCSLLPDNGDVNDCQDIEDECSTNGENFYVVVWEGADLSGPIYIQVAASVLSALVWVIRLSVVWYYGNRLAKV